ncbi:Ig-like domain-containing protein, partial [Bacillus sp. JJ1764]|uniref:Ig-like domain-containing protein n=1 Tax=Bacillus sp. JJ1764 TaxID=3122964 RepID=UPI003000C485
VTDADVVIKGTAEKGSTVIAKVNGKDIGKATADPDGIFIINIMKQTAESVIIITATDAAGNTSEKSEVTVKDVTAPAAPVVNPVTDADVVIKGTAEKGSTVIAKVNGKDIGMATANRYGQFSIIIKKLTAGTVVVVVASDRAGNVSKAASVRVKDATAPLAPVINPVTD